MDEDQRSARANDEVEDDDVEAHLRTGRAASEEQADETEGEGDDFELHQRTGR